MQYSWSLRVFWSLGFVLFLVFSAAVKQHMELYTPFFRTNINRRPIIGLKNHSLMLLYGNSLSKHIFQYNLLRITWTVNGATIFLVLVPTQPIKQGHQIVLWSILQCRTYVLRNT